MLHTVSLLDFPSHSQSSLAKLSIDTWFQEKKLLNDESLVNEHCDFTQKKIANKYLLQFHKWVFTKGLHNNNNEYLQFVKRINCNLYI